ncbi:O-antigen ligase family protein [Candidatus Falkowbacteria bacterium]|nr:O-antigen ligase family protein [Candidatus Falkowbacteria bacterium]NCT54927.1 O-antigen ligase family protein [Candidatus Falkowbacteria bacterium]
MAYIILAVFLILFFLFLVKPKAGLYLMALTLPVIGFELAFFSLALPLIDFVALALLLAFAFRLAFNLLFSPNNLEELKLPLFFPFFLFLLVSFVSAILSEQIFYSVWYFCRWPLFLYLAYIFVPYNLIKDQKTLKKVIIAAATSSLIVLIFGFLSLYGQDLRDSFFRIRSVSLAGVFPFGENHNLIAEFLNVGAFFILSLRFLAKDLRLKRLLDVFFILSILGIILTFSRSGWIVLFLQGVAYSIIYLRDRGLKRHDFIFPIILLLLFLSPLFFKMGRLQSDNTSSNENRLLLTQIAFEAFKEKPLLGHGSGSFILLVEDNLRFATKYGEAIDSHGVLQKNLAENGVLGFLAWLFILAALIKIFIKAINKYSLNYPWLTPLILGALGGLFFQFLNTSYYKGKVWLPIVLVLLAIKLLDNQNGKMKNKLKVEAERRVKIKK